MADPLVLVQSRTVPFPVEQAFAFTLPAPLPAIFSRWWGPLPPISGVDGPDPWGTPGQVRRIRTADGASMREELLTADAPDRFTYRLTEVAGALKRQTACGSRVRTARTAQRGRPVTCSSAGCVGCRCSPST